MRNKLKTIYSTVRRYSPSYYNGKLNQLYFSLSGKPFVKTDDIDPVRKFPNKESGGVIISADFEMSWAWRYTKSGADYLDKGRIERNNLPDIVRFLETYNIPITFATVGHLFLESCKKYDHEWMQQIPHFDDHWKFTNGDWYSHDPHTNYNENPEWYAPDLIQVILDSKVDHEIGSHTFSHIDFSYKNCPPKVAEDEITACIKIAADYDLTLESMVFPGGTWGNIEVLKRNGFKIYRKKEEFDLAYPYRDQQGLLVTVSSGSLEYNLEYKWSTDYYIKRLKKIVRKAVKTGTIAHLWFHPSLEPYILKNVFPEFLSFLSDEREKGNLWIGTMNKIAEHINSAKLI